MMTDRCFVITGSGRCSGQPIASSCALLLLDIGIMAFWSILGIDEELVGSVYPVFVMPRPELTC